MSSEPSTAPNPAPTTASTPRTRSAVGAASAKRIKAHQNRIYAHPLPLLLNSPAAPSDTQSTTFASLLSRLSLSPRPSLLNPLCVGVYERASRSVWVTNERDVRVLWTRGFFGKGSLSRSEPTWLDRRRKLIASAESGQLTAEEITARRRVERRQMKVERARALAEAQQAAEAALTGVTPPASSAAMVASPPPSPARAPDEVVLNPTSSTPETPPPKWEPLEPFPEIKPETPAKEGEKLEKRVPAEVENLEHLQLTLPEALFLAWGMDCLKVLDPATNTYLPAHALWREFLLSSIPHPSLPIPTQQDCLTRFDNPFLVSFVAYSHFRALGWVVKSGIKFCVDLVLYKRGPVFHHAEFAVVVCPQYEDPADKANSPFRLDNADRLSWQWLNTINRVNSQAKKTLILAYVTIPSSKRVSPDVLHDPRRLGEAYSVREVTVRRFVPARMRD